DHYLDLEDYEGQALPADRYQAIALLVRLKRKPERAGLLPYAILENYDRLSCAFYDLRAGPDNPAIRAKPLVYAGVLPPSTGDRGGPPVPPRARPGRGPVHDGPVVRRLGGQRHDAEALLMRPRARAGPTAGVSRLVWPPRRGSPYQPADAGRSPGGHHPHDSH